MKSKKNPKHNTEKFAQSLHDDMLNLIDGFIKEHHVTSIKLINEMKTYSWNKKADYPTDFIIKQDHYTGQLVNFLVELKELRQRHQQLTK